MTKPMDLFLCFIIAFFVTTFLTYYMEGHPRDLGRSITWGIVAGILVITAGFISITLQLMTGEFN